MRKQFFLLGLLVFFNGFVSFSQEEINTEKFSYRSFSITPMGLYFGSNTGVSLGADVSFDYGKNIFSANIESGTEGNFIGSSDQYVAANLLYGRSFRLNEKIFTDVFVGAGYFNFLTYGYIDSFRSKGDIKENTIGFPIGAKVQFMLGPRYSMGLKLGANINSVESIGTLGLVLQWNKLRN
ncbi:MAG: hypothetical protein ACTIJ9_05950 [Aequorivita sp.]